MPYFRSTATLLAALAFMAAAHAAAPGEDPLVLNGPVSLQGLPTAAPPKSGGLDPNAEMPAWLRARVARYESKAFAEGAAADNVLSDNDVITTAGARGLKKACVQEIGSNTASATSSFNSYGPKGQQQVVVLRGDLVNICR